MIYFFYRDENDVSLRLFTAGLFVTTEIGNNLNIHYFSNKSWSIITVEHRSTGNCRKIWRHFYKLIMKTSQNPLLSEGSGAQNTVGKVRKGHRVPYLVNMLGITQEEKWRNYNIFSEEENQGAKRQDSHWLLFYIFWILKCWKYIDFHLTALDLELNPSSKPKSTSCVKQVTLLSGSLGFSICEIMVRIIYLS